MPLNKIVCSGASSFTMTLLIPFNLGGSLTALTVNTKLLLALFPLVLLTVTVTTARPN